MGAKHLLTVDEVAELLRVPKSWIYDRTYRNAMPHIKMGRLLRFDEDQIGNWLDAQRRGNDTRL